MNVIQQETAPKPTEHELRSRIERHLHERPGHDDVIQAWDSYLCALLEWGLLDHQTYGRLAEALPPHERKAVDEIMLGFDGEMDGAEASAPRALT